MTMPLDVATRILNNSDTTNHCFKTSIVGSLAKLSTEPFPAGEEGWTLINYTVATGVSEVYKYISGDWRKL
ncbi:hypothetical protein [Dehalobacter restrictus]|uniref:Uncharacterized protein n=1 Tax=Dehalobacter restrictus TaxID=55583 RepID=A0A857DFF4_9FIRM|nr:hypothetical protein [Dehalobacter restrictus]QGZ99430.1 hypothetical protein GQ588_01490 [Dehalobacter restrictus]